jgi:hypothetical protein
MRPSRKGVSQSTVPPALIPTLRLVGTSVPDLSGDYIQTGTSEGKPYYQRSGTTEYIFWNPASTSWHIFSVLDSSSSFFLYNYSESPEGTYYPGIASGSQTATFL